MPDEKDEVVGIDGAYATAGSKSSCAGELGRVRGEFGRRERVCYHLNDLLLDNALDQSCGLRSCFACFARDKHHLRIVLAGVYLFTRRQYHLLDLRPVFGWPLRHGELGVCASANAD